MQGKSSEKWAVLCNFHGVRQEQDVKTTTRDSKLAGGGTSTSQSPQAAFSFLLFFFSLQAATVGCS